MSEGPTRIDKTEARAGQSGVGVRYVLIGGLALVIIIFAVLAVVLTH